VIVFGLCVCPLPSVLITCAALGEKKLPGSFLILSRKERKEKKTQSAQRKSMNFTCFLSVKCGSAYSLNFPECG